MPATATITPARRSSACRTSNRWRPATPTSYSVSTSLSIIWAVMRASSATGMSLVPAQTTKTGRGGFSPCRRFRLTVRARSWYTASGAHARMTSACAGVARVASRSEPLARMLSTMARRSSVRLPWQKTTSGNPHRLAR